MVAERIRTGFKSINFSVDIKKTVQLTVSLGVAEYIPKEDIKDLVKRADTNMYTAKGNG